MFDVGFSELLMVGLVALLVLGPEKLPKAARLAGFWLGKARSTVAAVQIELQQELHAEEIRQMMNRQLLADEIQQTIADTETEINNAVEAWSDPKTDKPNDHPA